MYPLVETIKIKDCIPQNLRWHQIRYDETYQAVYRCRSDIRLEEIIEIPPDFKTGIVKARFLYDKDYFCWEFQNYITHRVRSLKIIENNEIDYSFKFTNRQTIQQMFRRKGTCDDILIVKKGRITDTSIANIVFFDGDVWVTPEHPLLKGTARARLLNEHRILIHDIHIEDLPSYSYFRLINAMLDFDEQEMIDTAGIK